MQIDLRRPTIEEKGDRRGIANRDDQSSVHDLDRGAIAT
jgi:hypothetical protein